MSWKKSGLNGNFKYTIGDGGSRFHHIDDMTLSILNDRNRQFRFTENQEYVKEYFDSDDLEDGLVVLPKGIYKLNCPDVYSETVLIPWELDTTLKLFELDAVKKVLHDFRGFQSQKDLYSKLKMAYKRGVLLYGPPGTGKTCAINMIVRDLIDLDAVIIFIDGALSTDFLMEMKNDPRLKLFIFEELTQTIDATKIARFLTFLDGENSLDNCYILATTNYADKLPNNIVDRPGRFDLLLELDEISAKDRSAYLEHYIERAVTEDEIHKTKKYSMAFLKELVLISLKNNVPLLDAIAILDQHTFKVKTKFKKQISDEDMRDEIL